MRRAGMVCDTVQLFVRDNELVSYERQTRLALPNRTVLCLLDASFSLFKSNHSSQKPIRALGVRACGLSYDDCDQISISQDADDISKHELIDSTADGIREKFGRASLKRGILLTSGILGNISLDEDKCAFKSIGGA